MKTIDHLRVRVMTRKSKYVAVIAALAIAAMLAACGGSSGSTNSSGGSASSTTVKTGSSETSNAPLASSLPAKYRGKTLTAATNPFPPYDIITPGGVMSGEDADLYAAMGKLLGVKFHWVDEQQNGIIPGIQAGRYQAAGIIGDFVSRQKVVDMTDYARGSSSLLVTASSSYHPTTMDDLCGHTIGIQQATAEVQVMQVVSKQCTAQGKSKPTVLTYPGADDVTLALTSGRIEGELNDSGVNGYAAKQDPSKFKNLLLAGCQQIAGCGAIFAIASPKGSGLAQAYQAAIKRLIANGTYKQIFDKWGMEGNILPASQVKIDGSHAQLPG